MSNVGDLREPDVDRRVSRLSAAPGYGIGYGYDGDRKVSGYGPGRDFDGPSRKSSRMILEEAGYNIRGGPSNY